ncbi:Protein LHCP translocation defect [Vitis vinifera]|uniref:Protein LHCP TRANSLOCATION DEFECT n=1 Tax=Vitis vinifera TaxID=29760 RepID=A0A438DXP7_VITVI|nr:Protein LHCP translocation defect [Vitis vinifera]
MGAFNYPRSGSWFVRACCIPDMDIIAASLLLDITSQSCGVPLILLGSYPKVMKKAEKCFNSMLSSVPFHFLRLFLLERSPYYCMSAVNISREASKPKRLYLSIVLLLQCFNYMGMLAVEGTYDKMKALLSQNIYPVDILLMMAASEGDKPKIEELLRAGASYTVKGAGGWTALERAANDEIKDFILNSTFQLKRLNLEICLKS